MSKKGFIKKTKARRLALQAIYSWLMSNNPLLDIETYFLAEHSDFDEKFFHLLLHEVPSLTSKIDEAFTPYLSRDISAIDPIELCILRMGTYELLQTTTPFKAVINEYLELSKTFGSDESHKFVNVVLDKVASSVKNTA